MHPSFDPSSRSRSQAQLTQVNLQTEIVGQYVSKTSTSLPANVCDLTGSPAAHARLLFRQAPKMQSCNQARIATHAHENVHLHSFMMPLTLDETFLSSYKSIILNYTSQQKLTEKRAYARASMVTAHAVKVLLCQY